MLASYELKVFDNSDKTNLGQLQRFIELRVLPSGINRVENYTHDRMFWDENLVYTCLIYQDSIVGFATALRRQFYPANSVRILNRLFLLPEHRFHRGKESVAGDTIKLLTEAQINFIQEKTPGNFKWFFMSREAPNSRFMRLRTKICNQREIFNSNWRIIEDLCLVCNDPQSKVCWQHISYTSCNEEPLIFDRTLTLQEFRRIFLPTFSHEAHK